jgi:hypothetical protein
MIVVMVRDELASLLIRFGVRHLRNKFANRSGWSVQHFLKNARVGLKQFSCLISTKLRRVNFAGQSPSILTFNKVEREVVQASWGYRRHCRQLDITPANGADEIPLAYENTFKQLALHSCIEQHIFIAVLRMG